MSTRTNKHLALNLPPNKRSSPSPSPAPVDQVRPQETASASTVQIAQPQLQRPMATPILQSSTPEDENILRHADPAVSSSLSPGIGDRGRKTTCVGNPGPKCFRIANVPQFWDEGMLLAALKNIDPFLEGINLQLSLYPACCGTTQTALFHLHTCTSYFQLLKRDEDNDVSTTGGVVLVIDSHFHNLTPLNLPGDDVVAEFVLPYPALPNSY